MLHLISHVVQISARRDRTEINSAMVDALCQLFHPRRLTIFRCYTGAKKPMVYACASHGPEGKALHNAYLPDKNRCAPLERDALLLRCRREKSTVLNVMADGSHRIVFPIMLLDEPIYLIDLVLAENFPGDQRVVLMGLVEYFGNHINLLDYASNNPGEILKWVLGALVVLYLLFGVIRPVVRDIVKPKPVLPPPGSDAAAAEGEGVAGEGGMTLEDLANLDPKELARREYDSMLEGARQVVRADPRMAAQIIKEWVNNDE